MKEQQTIAVLGSTGSVGVQSLDVAKAMCLKVDLLAAGTQSKSMEAQARAFSPRVCVMANEDAAKDLKIRLKDTSIKVYGGEGAVCDALAECAPDVAVNAILGEAGLKPTLAALSSCRRLALSNKESMVIAGEIVRKKAQESGCEIIPVDSEHSAIFQCLQGNAKRDVKRLLLTASGGPFFGYTKEQLKSVTKAQTLAHPTWQMGQKITVDSATMMNKGFEIIEAVRLFDIPADRIEVLVHRQSIIHSAVEYIDNVVMAQMGVPDMRTCVAYAITYRSRGQAVSAPLDLASVGTLTFARPDEENFPLLKMAKEAVAQGGAVPGVLNAANEVAVAAFLNEKISFCDIASLVIDTCRHFEAEGKAAQDLEEILNVSAKGRAYAEAQLN